MKILFDEIKGKDHRYSFTDSSWYTEVKDEAPFKATAEVSLSRESDDTLFLQGLLEGLRRAVCDCCVENFDESIRSEFVYWVTTRQEKSDTVEEVEVSLEDAQTLYLNEPTVDLAEILREQSYLAVPIRNYCNEKCKGLCPQCGANLNKLLCTCEPLESHSPFAILGKLNKQSKGK